MAKDVQYESKTRLLDARQMRRIVRRMAGQIVEQNQGTEKLMLVGIRTRGVPLVNRIREEIERMEGVEIPEGTLDITLYRDDLSAIAPQPVVKETHFGETVEGHVVVLCDDVLYTGRTIRAALDALVDFGRPKAVRLAVLVDRGHRELPIQADIVGRRIDTKDDDVVSVSFEETDGTDGVEVLHGVKQ